MSRVSIFLAEFDHNTPLVLEFNEITSLMAISSVGNHRCYVAFRCCCGQGIFQQKGTRPLERSLQQALMACTGKELPDSRVRLAQ
jgi:hypothetical protein